MLILISILIAIGLVSLITKLIIDYKNIKFVEANSFALEKLDEINSNFKFITLNKTCIENDYDNENFYNSISPKDYLTYELVNKQKQAKENINKAQKNRVLYEKYNELITKELVYDSWKIEPTKNKEKFLKIEKKLVKEKILKPTTEYTIKVVLRLRKINGELKEYKRDTFSENTILAIISKLNYKISYYYKDREIWNSICRVERGKVSNKMRFSIYKRDEYKCRNCGKKTNDLEIDHIIPIAKGGKSIYSNLQTLCHKCNQEKGSKLDF